MYSPDGTQMAFTSNRDGNPEIYIMNVDGAGVRRLTNHPAIDTTPTWSPTGNQIAFTSERGGTPSIWIVGVDGLNPRRITFENSDRATWSPAPRNEIAYSARTGAGYDIKVLNLATNETRQIDVRRGHQREPGVGAQRPASRVHVDAAGARADLHGRLRRSEPAPDHASRQQPVAALVAMSDRFAHGFRTGSLDEVHDADTVR